MIKQLSESRSLRKITLGGTVCTMIVGLISAFSMEANAGSTTGSSTEDSKKKYIKTVTQVTCPNTTATNTKTGGSGTVSVSVDLGTIVGKYGASVGKTGGSGTTTVEPITVVFPKNADGSEIYYSQVTCAQGGQDACTSYSPCASIGMQIATPSY